ncbi:MAG: MFS transporter [Alphaproteobacteria bacterium]|nr:MFS transporter [Alphaproteobacteria bacterium]
MPDTSTAASIPVTEAPAAQKSRTMGVAGGAHALHDGFTDLLYVLLPVWQSQFGLGYAEIGALRALYAGAMAGFQTPAGALADRYGRPLLLALGTMLSGVGFLAASAAETFFALAVALAIGGLGSSTQHPIASSLVSAAFSGGGSRRALGIYNFAGDLGKMALPAATALLLTIMPWTSTLLLFGVFGIVSGLAILLVLRSPPVADVAGKEQQASTRVSMAAVPPSRGFSILLSIGVIDSATRMGFLTFLPFLLTLKGASLPAIGVALTVLFAGGAAGKLVCAWLGERLGVLRTVWLTEGGTALAILAMLPLPLEACFVLLPVVGVALNGTSSVIYGTVPELVPEERRTKAFGIFYTGTIGGGALAPIVYGLFSDAMGVPVMMMVISGIVLVTLPLSWWLCREAPYIRR